MIRAFRGAPRAWIDLPLMSKGMIIISIPLATILFSAVSFYIFQQQRGYLDQWISRAFNAGNRIQSVVTLLVDAENGTRGFLLTRDPRLLEPFRKAERELPQRLARLKEGIRDTRSQLERVERVETLSQERLAGLSSIISNTDPHTLSQRMAQGNAVAVSID